MGIAYSIPAQGRIPAAATQSGQRCFVVECSANIARPAEAVWQAARHRRAEIPERRTEETWRHADGKSPRSASGSEIASLVTRVIEVNERLMLLRMEMAADQASYSWCQSMLLVQPVSSHGSRITITCLAMSAAEPRMVEEVLKNLLLSSLHSLKQRLDTA